jgi:hypothetical protein
MIASLFPAAGNQVHNQRDDGKDDEQMNQQAADVQDEKPAYPKKNQNNRQDQEHLLSSQNFPR